MGRGHFYRGAKKDAKGVRAFLWVARGKKSRASSASEVRPILKIPEYVPHNSGDNQFVS